MPVGAAGPLWSECYLHRCGLIHVFALSLSWITALKSKHYRVRPGKTWDMREHTLSNTVILYACTLSNTLRNPQSRVIWSLDSKLIIELWWSKAQRCLSHTCNTGKHIEITVIDSTLYFLNKSSLTGLTELSFKCINDFPTSETVACHSNAQYEAASRDTLKKMFCLL